MQSEQTLMLSTNALLFDPTDNNQRRREVVQTWYCPENILSSSFMHFIKLDILKNTYSVLQGPEDIEPYSTFMRKESGLYSTARVHVTNSNTNNSNMLIREDSHAGNVL